MDHVLYETTDPDAPDVIKDQNGEVVLGLCRICGRAEVELDEPCTREGGRAATGGLKGVAKHHRD